MTTLPKFIHPLYCQSVTREKLRPSEGQKIQKANPPIGNLLVYMDLSKIMVASLFWQILNQLLFNRLSFARPPHPWILAFARMTYEARYFVGRGSETERKRSRETRQFFLYSFNVMLDLIQHPEIRRKRCTADIPCRAGPQTRRNAAKSMPPVVMYLGLPQWTYSIRPCLTACRRTSSGTAGTSRSATGKQSCWSCRPKPRSRSAYNATAGRSPPCRESPPPRPAW